MRPVTKTDRGFYRIDFLDRNGEQCSVQESSAIDFNDDADSLKYISQPGSSLLWLGTNGPMPGRMHLDRQQVKELIEVLQRWHDTGTLAE